MSEAQNSQYAAVTVNPGRVLRAIARIGYTPESAICDIVDNSVGANASHIAIELERDPGIAENRRNSAARYVIADNGKGMSADQLVSAFGLGADSDYPEGSLGKFGLGLKSAGLSQGDRIEVISSQGNSNWSKAVLDLPHIEEVGKLECQLPSVDEQDFMRIERLLGEGGRGTIVTIEKIHRKNHPSIRKTRDELERVLGVTYLYFLHDGDGHISLTIDGKVINPFDPLWIAEADSNGNLDERAWDGRDVRWLVRTEDVVMDVESRASVKLEATQLVHPPAFKNPAEIRKRYMISSRDYGFFVYRNKRLIRWAERFSGIVPTDQDYFAFRGRILLDDTADDVFNIDVKKSEVLLSEEAWQALDDAVYEARRKSKAAWLNAARLLKQAANDDPISKASEALEGVQFPDILPTDPDDELSEEVRKERERKEAQRRPLKEEEEQQARREGSRVVLVDQLDDNALWERAYDATLGTIVRLNRSHRFVRLFYERFGSDADVVLLTHALFLSLAVAESRTIRNLQDIGDDELEEVFQRYRDQASASLYTVTAEALQQRFA